MQIRRCFAPWCIDWALFCSNGEWVDPYLSTNPNFADLQSGGWSFTGKVTFKVLE